MTGYLLKLGLLLPAIAALIWGSLRLARRMTAYGAGPSRRCVRLVETLPLSPGLKLAVVEFHGREVLVGCARNGLVRLAEADARRTDEGPGLVIDRAGSNTSGENG